MYCCYILFIMNKMVIVKYCHIVKLLFSSELVFCPKSLKENFTVETITQSWVLAVFLGFLKIEYQFL